MTPLRIRLLGVPEVSCGKRPLSFRTRKVLALLIYLVAESGMHSRESLMALLWPEAEAHNAAATLRATLSRLRRSLRPAGEFLLTESGKVGFDFDGALDLDLDWLAAAISAKASPRELRAIMAYDRGDFLDGFSLPDAPDFDTWCATQRQLCQQRVDMVYDRLVRHQLELGQAAVAVETATRWSARAPLNETASGRLMAAQAMAGDRAAALATYARCRQNLKSELDIEPARETVALAGRIRESGLRAVQPPLSALNSPLPALPSLLPFVGRTEERSQLAAAFRQTVAAGAHAVVVIGAGGVGKTRLIHSFLQWLLLESSTVEIWQGRAFEMGGSLPYEPVIEALRLRLEQHNAPEDLLEDVWLAELSQLVPELRARYPDLPLPMSGDANFVRSRLFAAVATLGRALTLRDPAVLVLDDMQWADADTRDMVHYLCRRWAEEGVPVLVLLTISQEQYAAAAPLREWLTRLERDVSGSRLLLEAFSAAAVRQLVANLAVPGVDEAAATAFADWLWAETSGLPFFIEALLQMLREEGVLATGVAGGYDFAAALQHVKSVTRVALPPGVRDVIRARLERVTETEAAILLAAAVLGREGSFMRLCRVAGIDETSGLPALEALLKARLIAESGTARRPYALAHDHIRQVIYDESGEARRRVLHRRALISLEADGAAAAECAFHAVASLLDEPAFRHSLAAGDEALAKHGLQESRVHYRRAREAARMMGNAAADADPERLLRLYQNRGRMFELTYQYEAAEANYLEMAELAETRRDPLMQQAALSARCIIHATHTPLFNPPLARELGQAALDLAQALNDRPAEARALWCMMLVEFHVAGDSKQVLAYGEKALAMARELGLKELEGFVLSNLSWAYLGQEQLEPARQANREAGGVWQTLGNLPMVADTYTIRLAIQRLAGDYDAVLATGPEALELSQSIDNVVHQQMALLTMADIHGHRGELGQALTHLRSGMAIGEASGDALSLQGYYASLILPYLAGGAVAEAEQWADRLYALDEELMPVFRAGFLANVARAKLAAGKVAEAAQVIDQAFSAFHANGFSTAAGPPLFVANAHLQLALQNPEGALEGVERLIARAKKIGSRYYLAEALWLKGKVYLARAKMQAAKTALLEAKAVAEAQQERCLLWQILADLAHMATVDGDTITATALREQACATASYIADHIDDPWLRENFLAQTAVALLDGQSI